MSLWQDAIVDMLNQLERDSPEIYAEVMKKSGFVKKEGVK